MNDAISRENVIDALTHLPLFASVDDAARFLAGCAADGVSDVICAGTDPRRDATFTLAKAPLRLHRAFGIHPERASDAELPPQLAALERALDGGPVVAVGEAGLDHRDGQPPLDVQERALREQLRVARRRRLPVVLHLVNAWSRALDVIESEGGLTAGGIWHAFAGPREAVARAMRVGLTFSIGGLVLNEHSRRLHEALPELAPDAFVVETDMPHVSHGKLVPERVVRLRDVVDAVARARGEEREDVARRTAANARRVFRLPA